MIFDSVPFPKLFTIIALHPDHNLEKRDTLFYRQHGCLAFSLRLLPKIKQFLSNCPASDWTFSFETADFC